LVKYWRSLGFPIVVYLDYEGCEKMSLQVQHDLLSSGFIVNTEKSVWKPTQLFDWLGFVWNLKYSTLEIPDSKFVILKDAISYTVEGYTQLTCRNLARIC
jgi:hypothetical protein